MGHEGGERFARCGLSARAAHRAADGGSLLEGAGEHAGRTRPIPSEAFRVNAADLEWVKSKVVPMALACFLERIRLQGNHRKVKKRTYVYAEGWSPSPFTRFYEKLKGAPEWSVLTMKTGHHAMLDDPEGFARVLLEAA